MPSKDWHAEDIKAAIRKRGVSLKELSLRSGFSETAVRKALYHPIVGAEGVIAKFLGVQPKDIWPSRYDANGARRKGLHSTVDPKDDRRRRHRQK